MAARQSKRAQLVALGWSLTPIPQFKAAGACWCDPTTGEQSPPGWDHKRPAAWVATPPPGFPGNPRRFDSSSPNPAVRWAWQQATAPRLQPDIGGVAGLVALMTEARRAGVVADGGAAGEGVPPRPDAELLAICGEMVGADRIADDLRSGAWPCPWTDKAGHQRASSTLGEACRTRDRLLPRLVEVEAVTVAGLLAKAGAVGTLFDDKRGLRAEAVRSLLADLAAVLRAGVGAGEAAS